MADPPIPKASDLSPSSMSAGCGCLACMLELAVFYMALWVEPYLEYWPGLELFWNDPLVYLSALELVGFKLPMARCGGTCELFLSLTWWIAGWNLCEGSYSGACFELGKRGLGPRTGFALGWTYIGCPPMSNPLFNPAIACPALLFAFPPSLKRFLLLKLFPKASLRCCFCS